MDIHVSSGAHGFSPISRVANAPQQRLILDHRNGIVRLIPYNRLTSLFWQSGRFHRRRKAAAQIMAKSILGKVHALLSHSGGGGTRAGRRPHAGVGHDERADAHSLARMTFLSNG